MIFVPLLIIRLLLNLFGQFIQTYCHSPLLLYICVFAALGSPFFESLVSTNDNAIVRIHFLRLENMRVVVTAIVVVDVNWG